MIFGTRDLGLHRFEKELSEYPADADRFITDFLGSVASEKIQKEIRLLMPVSDPAKVWVGKAPHAKFSQSMKSEKEWLSVTIKSKKPYHYLYFPDDGTNTRRHVGEQHFFWYGADNATEEIIKVLQEKIASEFENW